MNAVSLLAPYVRAVCAQLNSHGGGPVAVFLEDTGEIKLVSACRAQGRIERDLDRSVGVYDTANRVAIAADMAQALSDLLQRGFSHGEG
jgi:hypothetical protein